MYCTANPPILKGLNGLPDKLPCLVGGQSFIRPSVCRGILSSSNTTTRKSRGLFCANKEDTIATGFVPILPARTSARATAAIQTCSASPERRLCPRLAAAAQRCLCGAEVPSSDNIHVDVERAGLLQSSSTLLDGSQRWFCMYSYPTLAAGMVTGQEEAFQGQVLSNFLFACRPPLRHTWDDPSAPGTLVVAGASLLFVHVRILPSP